MDEQRDVEQELAKELDAILAQKREESGDLLPPNEVDAIAGDWVFRKLVDTTLKLRERERDVETLRVCNESMAGLSRDVWKALDPDGEYDGDLRLVEFAALMRKERGFFEHRVDELEAQLREREQRERWIPCAERLPEKSNIRWRATHVLAVIAMTNTVRELEYKEHDTDGNWYWFDDKWPYYDTDIKCWRPLPAPPTEAQR